MTLTTAGQFGPEALLDAATGRPLPAGTTVDVPAGYVAVLDSARNLTVTGPPSDAVVATVTPPGSTPFVVSVRVEPATSEVAEVAGLARGASATYPAKNGAGTETIDKQWHFTLPPTGTLPIGGTTTGALASITPVRVASTSHPGTPFKVKIDQGALFSGNGETHLDPQANFGFFQESGSAPSIGHVIELDYWTNQGGTWHHQSEMHELAVLGGIQRRPKTWSFHWDTGHIDYGIGADQLTVFDPTTAAPGWAFYPADRVILGRNDPNMRLGEAQTGVWYLGSGLTYDRGRTRFEALSGDILAGMSVGLGAIDFFSNLGQQAAGAPQTPRARLDDAGFTVESGNIWAKGGNLRVGSNGLSISQNGFAFLFNANFAVEPGSYAAFGQAVTGDVRVAINAGANDKVGLSVGAYTASQTADVFRVLNGAGGRVFAAGQNTLGFFGNAPVTKPTTVPVTVEGIHAALATLGLIAA